MVTGKEVGRGREEGGEGECGQIDDLTK